jgi:hypothetical protein
LNIEVNNLGNNGKKAVDNNTKVINYETFESSSEDEFS